jgi:hypothetical protein
MKHHPRHTIEREASEHPEMGPEVKGYLIHPTAYLDIYEGEFDTETWMNFSEIEKKGYHVKKEIHITEGKFNVVSWRGAAWLVANFRGKGLAAELTEQCSLSYIEPVRVVHKPWQEAILEDENFREGINE